MCGVLGWIQNEGILSEEDLIQARRALSSLAHRGPDGQGEWHEGRVYLGHRRLSIIDLSHEADQPFIDQTGRYLLTFNGEIYNYVELRQELEREGVRFRTRSDTEVMLAALIRWGHAALSRFDGMFAGGLHDRATGTHLLFRDPLGQKPIYYSDHANAFVYASELRALLEIDRFAWRIDRAAFSRYLAHGYYALEETPVLGIKKLLPGCLLEITGRGRRLARYWDSVPGRDIMELSDEEALAEFERLFSNSCRIALRSDVPYGVFLSGGIDSSLVLAACQRADPRVQTFSVAMEDHDFDESAKARAVASALHVDNPHFVTMDRKAVLTAVDAFFASIDEPHGDPGFVNMHFLAKSSRSYLTVALAGDGGDELFAGYPPFAGLGALPWVGALPQPVIAGMKYLSRLLPSSDRYLSLQFKLQAYLQGFPATPHTRFPLWLSSLSPEELGRLCPWLTGEYLSRHGEPGTLFGPVAEFMQAAAGCSPLQMLQYYYQKATLPEFVCHHTDRASMQSSMEVRSPFLSVPIICFANRVPDRLKMRGGVLKWLLKQTAARWKFPAEIVSQKKQGFTFPLARWLKTVLKPEMETLLTSASLDGIISRPVIEHIINEHVRGNRNNYRIIFNLMAFQQWRERYPRLALE